MNKTAKYLVDICDEPLDDFLFLGHSAINDGEDYLMHYGRLGMKWGQHIFGGAKSLSSKAKKVASNVKSGYKKASSYLKSKRESIKAKKQAKYDKKNLISKLSAKELQKRTDRLNAENNYFSALAKNKEYKKTQLQRVAEKVRKAAKEAAVNYTVKWVKAGVDYVLEEARASMSSPRAYAARSLVKASQAAADKEVVIRVNADAVKVENTAGKKKNN